MADLPNICKDCSIITISGEGEKHTVRTRHQETRLLKSGCPVSYKWTKEN